MVDALPAVEVRVGTGAVDYSGKKKNKKNSSRRADIKGSLG